jgi:hypothetical protein
MTRHRAVVLLTLHDGVLVAIAHERAARVELELRVHAVIGAWVGIAAHHHVIRERFEHVARQVREAAIHSSLSALAASVVGSGIIGLGGVAGFSIAELDPANDDPSNPCAW